MILHLRNHFGGSFNMKQLIMIYIFYGKKSYAILYFCGFLPVFSQSNTVRVGSVWYPNPPIYTLYSTGQCGIVTHQYTHCTVRVGSVWYPNPLVYTLYCWGQCGVLTHLYTQCTEGDRVVS